MEGNFKCTEKEVMNSRASRS